jgi:uncharacterized protein (DUF302 family)
MNYSYKKQLHTSFEDAVEKTKAMLAEGGFGVLTEINVKSTLKNKLNVDYDNYLILGACNPPFAYQALKAEKEIGLFLPCNIIVYSDNDKIFVSTILPMIAMGMINNSKLREIAARIEEKLKKVIDTV